MYKRWLNSCFNRFFAPDEGGGSGGEGGTGSDQGGTGEGSSGQEKTFTQAEVNAMMAKEKSQGRMSVLKELGIEDTKHAKESLAAYKKWVDDQKTDLQKAQEKATSEEKTRLEAESKLAAANNSLAALKAGVNPKYLDDVVALASARVTEKKDFAAVVEEMKTTHSMFFGEDQSSAGTGHLPNGGYGSGKAGDLGKRLAEGSKRNNGNSSFFK